ncbi:variable large family protein [Borreliella lusitaniae]|uniref:variable large family protein n=1 Tax=Borreliella lusitaniae TaxID=100177 RepID=UPI003AB60793
MITEMAEAAKKGATAATGGAQDAIGNVADAGANDAAGAQGDADSVKGIAEGMKGIVGAAAKMGVELKAGAVAEAAAAVGHLFATQGDAANANAAAIGHAAEVVSKVSGQQIIKAIIESDVNAAGQAPNNANGPVDAAIGTNAAAGADFGDEMLHNDKIAAAIVLRGMAAGGKFALANAAGADAGKEKELNVLITEMAEAAKKGATGATGSAEEAIGNVAAAANGNAAGAQGEANSVKGIAEGMKGIVDVAKKMGVELKAGAAGAAEANANTVGRLFATQAAAADGTAAQIGHAAEVVSKVSGQQIIKAIIESDMNANGAAPNNANANPVSVAIGTADGAGADFGAGMTGNDKIAAAIVLRGMAAGGKFALANAAGADAGKGLKSAVEKLNAWITEMAEAAKKGATAATGGAAEAIGNVAAADANAGAQGDANSVKGIAEGMKGIVDVAKKMGVELKAGAAGAADAAANTVGHLFATQGNAANANAAAIGHAAEVVSKVSGQQIIKAIIESDMNANGALPGAATGPVSVAIGAAGAGADFGAEMLHNDKIAAAIVLQGMAAGGKFALAQAAGDAAKNSGGSAVEGAVKELNAWITEMTAAAKKGATAATGGAQDAIGNVAAAGNAGAQGDANSVKGIAEGMKGIVDAAKKMGVELKAGAAGAAAAGAGGTVGNLFATQAGNAAGTAAQIGAAADVVSKVSGQQIIKAIIESDMNANGALPGDANANPVSVAIGAAAADGAGMLHNDKIAAAIVLRGMAAGGKFALAQAAAGAGADFTAGMTGNDKIAAAIVLRGMAAGGKFALAQAAGDAAKNSGSAVEVAVKELNALIAEMAAAAKKGVAGATGGAQDAIGNVAAAGENDAAGAQGDANSVKGIAEGMKGIVEAAKKMGVELKAGAAGAAAAGAGGTVGHLFATQGNAADGTAAQIGAAADVVSKVSGQQIIKAIIESDMNANGALPGDANANPVSVAIGAAAADGAGMLHNDKIAAAIVLRGMAAGGKFALAQAAAGAGKGLKSTVEELNVLIAEMAEAAKKGVAGATGSAQDAIGNVADAANNDAAGAQGEADSVKGIAEGMKGIVDAAKKMGVELKAGAAGAAAAGAGGTVGNLFATQAGDAAGTAAQIGAAADVVSKVSGQQIIKAIVESDMNAAGVAPGDANGPVDAAIGANAAGQGADFTGQMLHDDKIAAAIVLRGMAAGGKFALAQAAGDAGKGLKSAVYGCFLDFQNK